MAGAIVSINRVPKMADVRRINDYLKGVSVMTKIDVWELVKKEAETIIRAIENDEVYTLKEIQDYLDSVYSWKFREDVMTIVNLYMSINKVEMPWDNE